MLSPLSDFAEEATQHTSNGNEAETWTEARSRDFKEAAFDKHISSFLLSQLAFHSRILYGIWKRGSL